MIENKMFLHLSTVNGLSTFIGTRIYPMKMPQPPTYPSIVYTRINTRAENSIGGYTSLQQVYIQIDIYSTGYAQSKSISTALHVAMGSATGYKALLDDDREFYEDELGVYRVSQDYSIWNQE